MQCRSSGAAARHSASHSSPLESQCDPAVFQHSPSFFPCIFWQHPCSKGHRLLIILTENPECSCFCWWWHIE